MSEGVLSQDEIDALLKSEAVSEVKETPAQSPPAAAPVPAPPEGSTAGLSATETDAIGEVANIVMGSAATALSTLLGKKVEITTPVVQLTDPDKFRQEYPLPYLLVYVNYVAGLTGANVLIIKDQDAKVMVDLMLDGSGLAPPAEFEEMHLSALSEAMNQMMGAASTAMATIIKDRVEVSPPTVETVNFATDELKGTIGARGQVLVKVSFQMMIEELLNSEIIQLIPLELAKEMVKNLMHEMTAPEPDQAESDLDLPGLQDLLRDDQPVADIPPQAAAPAAPVSSPQAGPSMSEASPFAGPSPVRHQADSQGVPVQPVQFTPLQSAVQPKEIANIDLIMDVPLQVTVELGKSRKTIREILALGPGSVVELDKLAGEPVDLLVNGKLLAKGEVVVIDENFGIRVTDIVSPIERVTNLQ